MMNIQANPTEQDIASMISNLEEAHKYSEEGRKSYQAQNYRNAAQCYHRCILYAKAVVQLTTNDLREMARAQMLHKGSDLEGTVQNEKENGQAETNNSIDAKMEEQDDSGANVPGNSRNRLDSTTRGQEIGQEAKELMAKCYNNLAACLLARQSNNTKEDYMRAVFYCDNVLKVDANNEKALFRKGVALMRAQKWENAIEQFQMCKNNAQAKLHIVECQRSIDEDRRRRDAEIRANFAKARAEEEAQNNVNGRHPPGAPPAPTMNGHVQHH